MLSLALHCRRHAAAAVADRCTEAAVRDAADGAEPAAAAAVATAVDKAER